MHLTVEKRPITWPQVIGWTLIIVAQAFMAGVLWATLTGRIEMINERVAEGERYRADRAAKTDANFAAVNVKLEPFDTFELRLAQAEAAIRLNNDAMNARVDRIADNLAGKLDNIGENVNILRTDVRVLTQRVDTSINGGGDKRVSLPPSAAVTRQ